MVLTIEANSATTVASPGSLPLAGQVPPLAQQDGIASLVITNVDESDWQDSMSHPVASQAPSLHAVMSKPHGQASAADVETNLAPGFSGSLLLVANEIEAITASAA
jgi:hypothetical protein